MNEWEKKLINKINEVSNQIYKSSLRGGANWVVVSSPTTEILDRHISESLFKINLRKLISKQRRIERNTYNRSVEEFLKS